jgi:anti-sigma regulatory factor (Ser/Thr protein kinase)
MGFGAGMGLPNIRKNTDKLEISSKVGEGTKLEMIIYY